MVTILKSVQSSASGSCLGERSGVHSSVVVRRFCIVLCVHVYVLGHSEQRATSN